MNAHARQSAAPLAPPAPPAPAAFADTPGGAPLTRVTLIHLARRFNLYLRFGDPVHTVRLDRVRRVAAFLPDALFCRVRWEANLHGTVRWQLLVLQGWSPHEAAQRIPSVAPGARLLLRADGERTVRAVLPRIDAIEALGIAPATTSPAYWRMLANRLAARAPLPDYTRERHVAWQAGRALP